MKKMDGGVTAAKGFMASNTAAKIKYEGRDDMAMIYSEKPCVTAGTFTSNIVKAAPVQYDKKLVDSGEKAHAIVINAGIANACTGSQGMEYCIETAKATAENLNISEKSVLVASTGVIGMQLPMDRIKIGIRQMVPALSSTREAANKAAKAIMTTDTIEKEVAIKTVIGGKEVTIGGMCKGSGMIHPNMCTMLSFLTSDVNISKELLQEALLETVNDSYNMISVDGDTSTNDTCVILANGLAENGLISDKGEDYEKFKDALMEVNKTLAMKMAGDGEGATALFEVVVKNADSVDNAKVLAKSVVTSSLTKAAIYGHDANWGRILCALGYSGVNFDPEKVDLYFESANGKLQIIENGVALDYSESEATEILSSNHVTAICDMHMGDYQATAWGCDLTYDLSLIHI